MSRQQDTQLNFNHNSVVNHTSFPGEKAKLIFLLKLDAPPAAAEGSHASYVTSRVSYDSCATR